MDTSTSFWNLDTLIYCIESILPYIQNVILDYPANSARSLLALRVYHATLKSLTKASFSNANSNTDPHMQLNPSVLSALKELLLKFTGQLKIICELEFSPDFSWEEEIYGLFMLIFSAIGANDKYEDLVGQIMVSDKAMLMREFKLKNKFSNLSAMFRLIAKMLDIWPSVVSARIFNEFGLQNPDITMLKMYSLNNTDLFEALISTISSLAQRGTDISGKVTLRYNLLQETEKLVTSGCFKKSTLKLEAITLRRLLEFHLRCLLKIGDGTVLGVQAVSCFRYFMKYLHGLGLASLISEDEVLKNLIFMGLYSHASRYFFIL